MKIFLSIFGLIWIMIFSIQVKSQGVIIHTSTGDFNKGNLNNVNAVSDNVVLPYQSTGYSVNWTSTGNMPDKRSNHKMSYWNNRVYLTGGMEMKGYSGGQEVLAYSPSVYMADISSGTIGTWTALDSLPVGVSDHAALVMNGYLYVMGGKSNDIPINTIYYTKILANGNLEGWNTCTATLPQVRWGFTAEFVNGYLVIAGGSAQTAEFTATNTVYTALVKPDGDIATFTVQSTLPGARNQHTMVRYGNTIYVLGGYDNSAIVKNTVYYSTVGLTGSCSAWQTATAFSQAVYGHTSTCYNGIITNLGGYSDTTGNAIAQCYYSNMDNAPTFSWQSNTYYPQHLAFADAFALDGQVFCLGGYDIFENTRQECNYNSLVMSGTLKVKNGVYLSPLINLASNTPINQLSYTGATLGSYTVYYRSALSGGTWSTWVNAGQTNPISLSLNRRYFQYMFSFANAPTNNTVTLNDVSLNFNASTFAGTLSGNLHWTLADSPYICTADATLSSGTLTIDPGVTVLFMNETGLEIWDGTLVCNGTSSLGVTFSSFSGERGSWKGLYFDSNSNDYTSILNYTIVELGGYGTRQANVYCYYTSKPLLDHCTIRNSIVNGLHLDCSSLVVNNTAFTGNMFHAICLQNNSFPDMNSISISENLVNGITILGSQIDINGTWENCGYDYYIWDNVSIWYSRLNISAGNNIRICPGRSINCYYGEIFAEGTSANKILFTPYNNQFGGWEGITAYSNGSLSSYFKYCIFEKGSQHNLYTDGNVIIDNCLFRDSNVDGLQAYGNTTVYNSVFENNAGNGIEVGGTSEFDNILVQNNGGNGFRASGSIHTGVINSVIQNNAGHGFCMNYANSPEFYNVTFNGNQTNNEIIVLYGGSASPNTLWRYEGMDYVIWENIQIENNNRLTIAAGNTIKGKTGCIIQISYGELYAIGKPDSLINFTSYNGNIGGWEGVQFWYGSGSPRTSCLKHCVFEKGNWCNLQCYTNQPLIDSCVFTKSAQYGVVLGANPMNHSHVYNNVGCGVYINGDGSIIDVVVENNVGDGVQTGGNGDIINTIIENNGSDGINVIGGSPEFANILVQNNGGNGFHASGGIHTGIINSVIQNNAGHGFCMNYANSPEFYNVTFNGNQTNNEIIVLYGGSASPNTLWRYEGMDYVIWENIQIENNNRLTIAAGNTIKGKTSCIIQISYGELYAIGKPDSLINFTSYNGNIGGWEGIQFSYASGSPRTSYLKHCVFEKGNNCNLTIYSDQPQIDSCIFTKSANYGLYFSNSPVHVKNSQIIYNQSSGIRIEGTTTPIIGNSLTDKCDVFGNSIYDIYNNSTSDVAAEYNYWGSTDPTFIQSRIYDKNDNSYYGYVLPANPADTWLSVVQYDIHGQVAYDNSISSALGNSFVTTKDYYGATLSGIETNINGFYMDGIFANGNYITTASTTTPWGGVNATDALKIMRHYALLELLTGLRLKAADVNASGAVNSTDVMQTLQRYTHIINSFASGDWYFEPDTVTIADYSVESNIKGICFGDVNGSYLPSGAKGSDMELIHEGSVFAGSFDQIELPVKVKKPINVAAISLGFYFPEEYLLIEGVSLGNGNTNIVWSSENGLLKLAWSQIEPYFVNEDEIMLYLNISTKDLSGLTEPIAIHLYEDVEIADEYAQVIQEITLSVPLIEAVMTGMHENIEPSASIYPNPANSNATINYTMPCQGSLDIQIYDVFGNLKAKLQHTPNYPGKHSMPVNFADYSSGVYFINMKVCCGSNEYLFKEKIIVQH